MDLSKMNCDYYGCNRTPTRFWGELADMISCEGHYIIMTSNSDSWHIPKNENGEHDEIELAYWINRRKDGNNWLKANPNPEPKEKE